MGHLFKFLDMTIFPPACPPTSCEKLSRSRNLTTINSDLNVILVPGLQDVFLGYLTKFYVEMPIHVSPRIFHIGGGVSTCQTPIGNWGLVNDLCRLVPAPPKYRGSTSHMSCVFIM